MIDIIILITYFLIVYTILCIIEKIIIKKRGFLITVNKSDLDLMKRASKEFKIYLCSILDEKNFSQEEIKEILNCYETCISGTIFNLEIK